MITDAEWEDFKASIKKDSSKGNYWPSVMIFLILSAGMSEDKKENRPGQGAVVNPL